MNSTSIAVQTIGIVTTIVGVPTADQLITGRAALIVAVETIFTEWKAFVTCIIASPDAISAAGTEDRFVFQTVRTKKLTVKRK